jgi:phosphatidylserine/phosphatidylglycerophosphate/cardiolipin synthase-like enzyme
MTLMLNGRTRNVSGKVVDKADTFVSMRETVESLVEGDFLYLTTWEFKPTLAPLNPYLLGKVWAELLRDKAAQGVKIRVIISLHSPLLSGAFNSDLAGLEKFINQVLPKERRDNFKFIASEHSATVKLTPVIKFGLGTLKAPIPPGNTVLVGDHHQKFMVVRKGKTKLAYCGGLDITGRRTPVTFNDPDGAWSVNWVWHDIHTKLEGAIVQDLEREFVERWNREKDRAKTSVRPSDKWKATKLEGWADHEKLEVTPGDIENRASDRNIHKVQMHRTVSAGAGVDLDRLTPQITRRDDIWQSYFTIIGRARRFLYLENQYFYEPKLANAIVRQMQANPELVVMVVVSTGTDDKPGPYLNHCLKVRHEFFTQLFQDQSLKNRIGVYTMFYPFGIVHSKLALADDEVLTIGSANANQRGFFLDSELNVMLEDAEAVRALRLNLWSHNLATPLPLVGTWRPSQFIAQWDGVALHNKTREKKPESMMGEGVIRFDPFKDDKKEKYPRSHLDIMARIPMLPDILC